MLGRLLGAIASLPLSYTINLYLFGMTPEQALRNAVVCAIIALIALVTYDLITEEV